MIIETTFGLLLMAGFAVQAQTVNLHGKISNQAGQAVTGAVVELAARKLKDTTGSDGMYSLIGPTTGVRTQLPHLTGNMALNGSTLELFLDRSQPGKLEVFDVQGNLLKREVHAKTFRYLPWIDAGYAVQRPSSEDKAKGTGLAKAAAVVDTLTVTASGFASKKVPLSSYDSVINVSLAPSEGGYALKNPPVPSAGCGKAATVTTSTSYRTITSSGDQRQYMVTMPPNYDMNKPYRIIYASHGQGGEGSDITREKYYSIQNIADAANSTIFVSASGLGGIWGLKDVPLFDDILDLVKQGACVDESRVFVLGFSFGGMYSYSLSMTRQKTIRAGIGMSPANYNIQIPTKTHQPIAWMQSTGMSDGTCPWVSNEAQQRGSKFIAIEHATDNGCTVPNPIPTWKSGDMLCDDFTGCKPGYPTRVCTFNGGHGLPPGSRDWMWSFINQF